MPICCGQRRAFTGVPARLLRHILLIIAQNNTTLNKNVLRLWHRNGYGQRAKSVTCILVSLRSGATKVNTWEQTPRGGRSVTCTSSSHSLPFPHFRFDSGTQIEVFTRPFPASANLQRKELHLCVSCLGCPTSNDEAGVALRRQVQSSTTTTL